MFSDDVPASSNKMHLVLSEERREGKKHRKPALSPSLPSLSSFSPTAQLSYAKSAPAQPVKTPKPQDPRSY
jgi:hypothetical protein